MMLKYFNQLHPLSPFFCPPFLPPSLVEYKPDMEETNAKALFQQQIPCTFLALQEKIAEKVAEMKKEERPPIMEEAEFRSTFKGMVEDDEELLEAVFFLNLQGVLLWQQ